MNYNVISEQNINQIIKTFELPNQLYPTGKYRVESLGEGKKYLDSLLNEISNYLQKNKTTKIAITIETGESAVPNYDREKYPSGGGTQLASGVLANLRGQHIKNYLENKLTDFKSLGLIPEIPPILNPITNIQTNSQKYEYVRGKDSPNDRKYLEDQYVKINLVVRSDQSNSETPTETVTKCLTNMTITFKYDAKQFGLNPGENRSEVIDKEKNLTNNDLYYCRGMHTCDFAIFNVYLGRYKLGTINFNNGNCSRNVASAVEMYRRSPEEYYKFCSKKATFTITEEIARKIAEDPITQKNKYMTLRYECAMSYGSCHSDSPEVEIIGPNNAIILPMRCIFPYDPNRKRESMPKTIILAKMGLCGENLQINQSPQNSTFDIQKDS